jgi:aromatic ring-cleaving dioxygenase
MNKLSEPDKELVSRVLHEVGFEERLVGYRVHQRLGPTITTMYSFEEVVHFLNDKFPFLKFEDLEKWLRTVIEDEELAVKIAEAVEEEKNDHDRAQRIKIWMGARLSQCKKASLS